MNSTTLFKRTALACAILLSSSTASLAATVTVQFDSNIFNGVTNPDYDVVGISYPVGQSANAAAGRFQGTVKSYSAGVDPIIFVDSLDNLFMYCYDLYEHVGGNWLVDYTINFTGESNRTLDFLGGVNSVLNAGKPAAQYDKFAWLHPTNGFVAAAVQLGIWESKYDSDAWDITGGGFRATGIEDGTSVWLNKFFNAIGSSDSLDGKYVMTLEARGAQDMITGDPPGAVPEPGTLGLLAAAGLGLMATRRRSAAA
jgi:hypothetical protein